MSEETREVEFLTMQEICIKFRLSPDKVHRLLKTGYLVGMKIPGAGGKHGQWRIVNPGPKFERWLRELEERLIHLPLLSAREIAKVAGYNYDAVRSLVKRGKLKSGAREGKRRVHLFTVAEARRLLWERQRMNRPARKIVEIAVLVDWAKRLLAKQHAENGANAQDTVEDEMAKVFDRILDLPEPQRSQSLLDLFRQLDRAKLLVDTARNAGLLTTTNGNSPTAKNKK